MSSLTIEDRFIQQLNLVDGLVDCANQAIALQFSQCDDAQNEEIQRIVSGVKVVAEKVEADGVARQAQGIEPAYHNRQHIVEVLTATQMLLEAQQSALEPIQTCLDLKQRLLLLIAAIGHDYLHDGGLNQSLADAERLSANAIQEILLNAGLSLPDAQHVHDLIMATARANVVENHTTARSHPDALDANLLAKLIISEVDIFASLMPNYGIKSGEKLAEECRRAGVHNASMIASHQGRQFFLTNSFVSSPHAKALGLDVLVKQQIV